MAEHENVGAEGLRNTWQTATGLLEKKSLGEIGQSFEEKPKGFMDTVKGWFSSKPSAPTASALPEDPDLGDKIPDSPHRQEPSAWQKFKNKLFGEAPPSARLSEAQEMAEIRAEHESSLAWEAERIAELKKPNLSTLDLGNTNALKANVTGLTNAALTDPITTNAPASTNVGRIR